MNLSNYENWNQSDLIQAQNYIADIDDSIEILLASYRNKLAEVGPEKAFAATVLAGQESSEQIERSEGILIVLLSRAIARLA